MLTFRQQAVVRHGARMAVDETDKQRPPHVALLEGRD
jgi:hypothetical protein